MTAAATLHVSLAKVSDLVQDPHNARAHSPRNLAAITASLERFGQRRPLVVTGDNVVVAGNGTMLAAVGLGWSHLAVTVFPGTAEEARAYAIADNRTGELASWDAESLAESLAGLDDELRLAAGFDDDELANLIARVGPALSLDELAAHHGEPVESALWPVLRIAVAPDVLARFRSLTDDLGDADDDARFAALVNRA